MVCLRCACHTLLNSAACREIVAVDRGLSIRVDREALPRAILRGVKNCKLGSEFDFELLIFVQHARPDVDGVSDQRVATLHGDHQLNVVLDHGKPR